MTPPQLLEDLARAGVPVNDLWDLVNGDGSAAAVPVLVDWLTNLEDRVAPRESGSVREGLVRALTIPASRPVAAPVLLDQFQTVTDDTGLGIRWVVGNALEIAADDSFFDDVQRLILDRRYGPARQMIVLGLWRSKDPRAVPLLIELLDDDDVATHAAMALGKRRADEARPALERHLNTAQHPLVRREIKKALKKLK